MIFSLLNITIEYIQQENHSKMMMIDDLIRKLKMEDREEEERSFKPFGKA